MSNIEENKGDETNKVRFKILCPFSPVLEGDKQCIHIKAQLWYHMGCKEDDWIDGEGYVVCGCPGKRLIMSIRFHCGDLNETASYDDKLSMVTALQSLKAAVPRMLSQDRKGMGSGAIQGYTDTQLLDWLDNMETKIKLLNK